MNPEAVSPAALYLVSENAPRRTILCATAGGFSRTIIHETEGVFLSEEIRTPEEVEARFAAISDEAGQHIYTDGGGQVLKFVGKAAAAAGVKLG
jgi:hypothetical protein